MLVELVFLVWGEVFLVKPYVHDDPSVTPMQQCEREVEHVQRIWRLGTGKENYRVLDGKPLYPSDMTVECRFNNPNIM